MSERLSCRILVAAILLMPGLAQSGEHDNHHQHHGQGAMPAIPPQSGDKPAGHEAPSAESEDVPDSGPAGLPHGFVPPSQAERDAAFPDVRGLAHHMHPRLHAYLLVDQLEWQDGDGGGRAAWEVGGWLGYDFNRLWLRSEGERTKGEIETAELQLLYGRAVARWWELVAGLRQDVSPTVDRSYFALGVQGLAPHWIETELTVYLGDAGQAGLRLELEYELLLTNRLILQPLVQLDAWSRRDRSAGIGAGLSVLEAGLRLRYEIRRELAPYVGLAYERALGASADLAQDTSNAPGELSAVAGLRFWF